MVKIAFLFFSPLPSFLSLSLSFFFFFFEFFYLLATLFAFPLQPSFDYLTWKYARESADSRLPRTRERSFAFPV